MVNTHQFRVLLAKKAARERRKITLSRVAEETGISSYTLSRLANNELREVPLDVLGKLCVYLGCKPGDLITLDEDSVPFLASSELLDIETPCYTTEEVETLPV